MDKTRDSAAPSPWADSGADSWRIGSFGGRGYVSPSGGAQQNTHEKKYRRHVTLQTPVRVVTDESGGGV